MTQYIPVNRNEQYPVTTPEARRRTTIEIAAYNVRAAIPERMPETLASQEALSNSVDFAPQTQAQPEGPVPTPVQAGRTLDDGQARMMAEAYEQLAHLQQNKG